MPEAEDKNKKLRRARRIEKVPRSPREKATDRIAAQLLTGVSASLIDLNHVVPDSIDTQGLADVEGDLEPSFKLIRRHRITQSAVERRLARSLGKVNEQVMDGPIRMRIAEMLSSRLFGQYRRFQVEKGLERSPRQPRKRRIRVSR